MLYLNENHLLKIGIEWKALTAQIERAVQCLDKGDFAQPIKPYLRYRNLKNRIIAMPAFVGGTINTSGIKWIASFPDNILHNIPRAHSVVVLNNAETGEPVAIINTALLSIVRTASVSGLFIQHLDKIKAFNGINLGIIGWGPIGQYHLKMCHELLGERISKVFLYDLRPIINKDDISFMDTNKITIVKSWEEAYSNSDLFITCTVSKEPYISIQPKKGAVLLNVSLRDYKADIYDYVKGNIVVDDWDEVCRENTDIENMHKIKGLRKEDTKSFADIVCRGCLKDAREEVIMFNPMGMAVFDISVGAYYLELAIEKKVGNYLE